MIPRKVPGKFRGLPPDAKAQEGKLRWIRSYLQPLFFSAGVETIHGSGCPVLPQMTLLRNPQKQELSLLRGGQ